MTIIVMTGDETVYLLPLYAYFFNKNFGENRKVTVLGFNFDSVSNNVPANFGLYSIGVQKDFFDPHSGTWRWSDAVLPYFTDLSTSSFLLSWLEHLIIKPVHIGLLDRMHTYIKLNAADKAVCDTHLNKGKFCKGVEKFTPDLVKLSKDTLYRTTLMPSIWSKDLFLSYLKPGMTSWDFELKNMKLSHRDNATIIAPKIDVIKIFNFFIKGKFNEGGFDLIKEDLDEIEARNIQEFANRVGKQVRYR